MENLEVRHKERKHKFLLETEGYEAKLKYKKKRNNILEIYKTEVPHAVRGQGVGNLLMKAFLTYAAENGFMVQTTCSFAQKYMEKHPEFQGLLLQDRV